MKFIIEQSGVKFEYPITEAEIVIGRSHECDIAIHDEKVSGRHFRMKNDGGRMFVQDLLSRNGTFVNGEKVETVEIRDGDVINIGSTNLVFKSELPGAQQAPASAPMPPVTQYPQYQQGGMPQQPSAFANASTQPAGIQFPQSPVPMPPHSQPGAIQPYAAPSQDPNVKIITQGDKVYMVDTQHERMVEIVPAAKAAGAHAMPAGASAGNKVKYMMLKYKKASLVLVIVAIVFIVLIAMSMMSPGPDEGRRTTNQGNYTNYIANLESAIELFDKDKKYDEAMSAIEKAKTYVPSGSQPKLANSLAAAINKLHNIDPKSIRPGTWTQLIDALTDLAGEADDTSKLDAFAQRKKEWAYSERKNEASYKGILDEYTANNTTQAFNMADQFPKDSIYTPLVSDLKNKVQNSIIEGYKDAIKSAVSERDWDTALNAARELEKYLQSGDSWLAKTVSDCENWREAKEACERARAQFDSGDIEAAVNTISAIKNPGPYSSEVEEITEELTDYAGEMNALQEFNSGKVKNALDALAGVSSPRLLSRALITSVDEEFKAAAKAESEDTPWIALEKWNLIKSRLNMSYFVDNYFLKETNKKLKEYKKETDWDQAEYWTKTGRERYNLKKYKSARAYFEEAVRIASLPAAAEEITKMKQQAEKLKNWALPMMEQDPPNLIDAQKNLEEAMEMLIPSDTAYPKVKDYLDKVKARRGK